MHRTIQIATSFAIVVVAYFVYSLAVVPLIEPSGPSKGYGGGNDTPIGYQAKRRLAEIAAIFPPGAWEHEAKVLQSDQFKILVQKYENQGNGVMKIMPCTIIFTPGDPDEATSGKKGRNAPIILQAPKGALLKFDRAINLKQLKLGNLVGGRFIGRVTVFSYGENPGKEDDLMFIAEDLRLNENEVYTKQPVQFSYGPHYGSGQEMAIKLAGPGGGESQTGGPKLGGVDSVVLKHLEKIHLEIPDEEGIENDAVGGEKTVPVEVTCRGPFCLNLADNVITFSDHVDVMRFYPQGESDQMNCELLNVFLAAKDDPKTEQNPDPAAKNSKKPGLDAMEPRRIEARGNPVILRAPRHKLQAQGRRLEYDMKGGRIVLDNQTTIAASSLSGNPNEVFLRQGPNEIHAVDLQYEPAKGGLKIGRLVAKGPGWFRGQIDDGRKTGKNAPPRVIEASWNGLLRLRPDNQYKKISPQDKFHAISIAGDAVLNFPSFGRLGADEIHFWMLEAPQKPKPAQPALAKRESDKTKTPELKPHSMLACGKKTENASSGEVNKVKINSEQIDALVDKLQVWFEEPALAEPPAYDRPNTRTEVEHTQAVPAVETVAPQNVSPQHIYRTGNTLATDRNISPAAGQLVSKKPKNHFHVVGRELDASVTLGKPAELTMLTIAGNVRLVETKTAKPDEEPVVVEGDRIIVRDASRPYAAVIVSGTPAEPARFHGRGLGLVGASINLNRGTNRLWMDCPGTMTMPPITQDLQGQPLSNNGPMAVRWQDNMEFDGRTITFEQSVVASSENSFLHTETLTVSLDRMVDFDQTSQLDDNNGQRLEVQEVRCRGGVAMQNRRFDEKGLLSTENLSALSLNINRSSGDILAAGPGVVTMVRRGAPNLNAIGMTPMASMSGTPQTVPTNGPYSTNFGNGGKQNAGGDVEKLTYLNVDFQDKITGNLSDRRINFHDQVKAVYGPVDSWQSRLPSDDPDAVGENGAILNCHRLSVTAVESPYNKNPNIKEKQNIELEAVGNTLVESVLYTARGSRMSFDQAKDLMIFEGDGRNPAALYHQKVIGGQEEKLLAKRIMYWPESKRTYVEGAQSVELHLDKQAMDKFRKSR